MWIGVTRATDAKTKSSEVMKCEGMPSIQTPSALYPIVGLMARQWSGICKRVLMSLVLVSQLLGRKKLTLTLWR